MKKTIILIYIFSFNLIEIKSLNDSTQLEFILTRLSDSSFFNSRFDSIEKVKTYFKSLNDMIFERHYKDGSYIIQFDSLITSIVDIWHWDGISDKTEYQPGKLHMNYLILKLSQNYKYLEGRNLFDSIINNKEGFLVADRIQEMDFNYLDSCIRSFTDCDKLEFIMRRNFNHRFQLIHKNINKVRSCYDIYSIYLSIILHSTTLPKDSLFQIETEFLENTNIYNQGQKDSLFTFINGTWQDPFILGLRSRDTRYDDSMRVVYEIRRAEKRRIHDSIEYSKAFPSWENMNEAQRKETLVAADTTLWEPENKIYMYRGSLEDDGMRFDTFSNAELIQFIDTLSFSSIYPYDTSCRSVFCVNTAQVHLHKVCQILGDRRAYGSFTPDSAQQAVVDRFIDTLFEFGKLDTPQLISIIKRSEAQHLMIRLGRLGFPTFMGLLTDPPFLNWDRICHPVEIYRQITEEEILQLVTKADAYLAQGDTIRAEDIATDLYRFFSKEVYVKPEQRRPRRPVAPTRERQRWADEYIWPLLLRMNHWYTRMK
jgi:hypothetical protein